MDVHAFISQYPKAGNISSPRSPALATPSGMALRAIVSRPVKQGDMVVSISSEAWRLGKTGLPAWVYEKMEALDAKPGQEAMEDIKWLAVIETASPPFYDDPDSDGVHGRVYIYTNEVATPESIERHTELNRISSTKTAEIYRTEKAKGSSAAEILQKTQQYMASLPDDYLRAIGWFAGAWRAV
jgi:hypothetical protein